MAFLNPRELRILRLLSRNWRYPQIVAELKIKKECLHTHCHHIRQKTGILDTKDPNQCVAYLREASARPPSPHLYKPAPTQAQLRVMEMLARGHTYGQIATQFKIKPQVVMNHASMGCKRAGISNQGHGRTQAIRAYLADPAKTQKPQPTPDLMDDPMF